jgi:hypothetical protein
MKVLGYFLCLLFTSTAYSQGDSSRVSINVNAFADGYYAHSPNRTERGALYPFLYNYNRNKNVHINHTWIKLSLASNKIRSNLALQGGTYVQDNYANEPGWAKLIWEANVGFALNSRKTVWLDAGIIPSHLGFESAGTLTNWTLSRSLIAENSPYYLTGAKLTWIPTANWELALLGFNGWQRIYESGRVIPVAGWQIKHQRERALINWSTFLGNIQVGDSTQFRFFNNVYYQVKLTPKFSLIADVDIGVQKVSSYKSWWGAALLARYELNEKLAVASRAEYYSDEAGLVINSSGFATHSFSLNVDYKPLPAMLIRAEFRRLVGQQSLANNQPGNGAVNLFTLAALAQVNFYKSGK